MAHQQYFHKADTPEGFVAVIAHRGKDTDALEAMGWVDSVDKLKQDEKEEKQEKKAVKVAAKGREKYAR